MQNLNPRVSSLRPCGGGPGDHAVPVNAGCKHGDGDAIIHLTMCYVVSHSQPLPPLPDPQHQLFKSTLPPGTQPLMPAGLAATSSSSGLSDHARARPTQADTARREPPGRPFSHASPAPAAAHGAPGAAAASAFSRLWRRTPQAATRLPLECVGCPYRMQAPSINIII